MIPIVLVKGSISGARPTLMHGSWGIRAISLHILLIALAIQGITPEFRDLASQALFEILAQVPRDAKTQGAGDALPLRDEDQNELPDDVYVAAFPVVAIPRSPVDDSSDLELAASGWSERLLRLCLLLGSPSRRVVGPGCDLVHSLSRLNC
jgi:hypothetical protein